MEFTRIESVKGTMSGGLGAVINYSIDVISNPDLIDYLCELSLKQSIMMDVSILAGQGLEHGEFISSAAVHNDELELVIITVGGTYSIEPDYNLLRRITRWGYNFSSDEALTKEDFRKAYGQAFGDHFYEKWVSLDRGIEPMVGYFADNIENGQLFLRMVMNRVRQYEKRLKMRK